MSIVSRNRLFLICLLLGLVVCSGIASAADINEKIGNRVDLKGTALNTDSIYLFVIGPGLPSNGVRLDNMNLPVVTGDPSTFTVTDVTNDQWAYSWNTARQGFSLKEGIYTVYAVKQPVAKSDVNNAVYGTIIVSLTYSGQSYESPGTIVFNTAPVSSEIFIDGQDVGAAPQTQGLAAGVHEIRLEYPGYQMIIEQVTVSPGSYITFQRTMAPVQTQTATATRTTGTPATAPSMPPLTPSATATTRSTPVSLPVIIGSISVALLALGVKARTRK